MKTAADTVDFGNMGMCRETDEQVRAILTQWKQQEMRLELAKIRESVNEDGWRRTFRDHEGNGGEVTMRIPPSYYHLYGNHYGYECWQDDDFCRAVLKHYPEMRVVSRSQTVTVVVGSELAGNKRFSKTYTETKTTN